MIRAGREHLVRTLADLAEQQGMQPKSYLNAAPYAAAGFPVPISSKGARTRLYDAEQVDAYLQGKPVPPLPDEDDDQDLLDRRECAAELGVSPRTWDTYKLRVAEHLVEVGGVEHCPRGIVRRYRALPRTPAAPSGRPRGAGDPVPQDQLLEHTAPLLDADPTISAARVTDALGVHRDTAQTALLRLRADRIADLMGVDASLTAQQAARALGYPAAQVRRATAHAEAVLRGRRAASYLARVTEALHREGWTATDAAPELQHPADDVCVAAVVLDGPHAPVPALVWDERHGWRTALSRRHPLGRGAAWPPAGDGIRHLVPDTTTPDPTDLVAALTTDH
ncbi:hypothetical protein [Streptomyces salyersiae]|uniref:Uncharacterized protein n=1 Tax=Streptomyces salyersiae TaxID=3075530 RepID=A0ABU2RVP9_9ACTN|nr:hypothetical protein [Streptomyces sp. DSM 41770]MDT0432910.1 hypothetical protein [Streptomyces sp. DSM 41770]